MGGTNLEGPLKYIYGRKPIAGCMRYVSGSKTHTCILLNYLFSELKYVHLFFILYLSIPAV